MDSSRISLGSMTAIALAMSTYYFISSIKKPSDFSSRAPVYVFTIFNLCYLVYNFVFPRGLESSPTSVLFGVRVRGLSDILTNIREYYRHINKLFLVQVLVDTIYTVIIPIFTSKFAAKNTIGIDFSLGIIFYVIFLLGAKILGNSPSKNFTQLIVVIGAGISLAFSGEPGTRVFQIWGQVLIGSMCLVLIRLYKPDNIENQANA